MSAQVTEAHKALICRIRANMEPVGHYEDAATCAQLIADSEAKAIGLALADITCTHHTDKERRECPVCLVAKLRKEIDWLQLNNDMLTDNPVGHARAVKERADLIAERDQLRAELAKERARLDFVLNWHITGHPYKTRATVDDALKEDGK